MSTKKDYLDELIEFYGIATVPTQEKGIWVEENDKSLKAFNVFDYIEDFMFSFESNEIESDLFKELKFNNLKGIAVQKLNYDTISQTDTKYNLSSKKIENNIKVAA